MNIPKPVRNLIEAFERLPGIGPKTARRLAFYLLYVPESEVDLLAGAVSELRGKTVFCQVCFNVDEQTPCRICTAPDRDRSIICVVENPLDVLAIEATTNYKGLYHVLHGVISPVNHIGPEDLKIEELIDRVRNLDSVPLGKAGEEKGGKTTSAEVSAGKLPAEIIIATNPSMEGEATAMYLKRQLPPSIRVTRIARGLPVGGDLEYADQVTLTYAFKGRTEF